MKHRAVTPVPDVSVVLAVGNAEEFIGKAARRVGEHLRGLGQPFELVAVNDGSWDTSFAVLQLLSHELPELRLLTRDASDRAFIRGTAEARGTHVVLMEAEQALGSLAPLGWALSRLTRDREAVVLRGRWIAARRLPALPVIARARGRAPGFERAFEREGRDLALEIVGSARRPSGGLLAPVLRFLMA
jgi:hypothetical protein